MSLEGDPIAVQSVYRDKGGRKYDEEAEAITAPYAEPDWIEAEYKAMVDSPLRNRIEIQAAN